MTKPTQEFYAIEDHLGPRDLGPMPELGEPGADSRETWRRVVLDGLATNYEISDYGRLLNFTNGHLLSPSAPNHTGTSWVSLSVDGKHPSYRVDKLVLMTFS